MVAQIQQQWGFIHAVINNASMFSPDQGTDYIEEIALQQLKVNLLAPMDLAKALADGSVLLPFPRMFIVATR